MALKNAFNQWIYSVSLVVLNFFILALSLEKLVLLFKPQNPELPTEFCSLILPPRPTNTPAAYGSCWARGQIGATAAGRLHHSHGTTALIAPLIAPSTKG